MITGFSECSAQPSLVVWNSMWDSEARKYSMPYSGGNAFNNSEDLHAWSIYRQNLNADFSESALGVNKSSNSERPFGNFQLKETTVNNILNHPKYGPRFKNQDAYTYLRFGLPRVKATQSEIGAHRRAEGAASVTAPQHMNGHMRPHPHQHNSHMTTDSSNASDSPYVRRKEAKRTWKSDPDLLRTHTESALHASQPHYERNPHRHQQRPEPKHITSQSLIGINTKSQSETDLRFANHNNSNGYGIKNDGVSLSGLDMSANIPAKHPHLIVRNLYYELDKSSTWRTLCGVRRQKLKVLDNISFDVRAGEMLALMTTTESEGTAILDILSHRYDRRKGKVKADLILNGVMLNSERLSQLLAYVSQDTTLCPDMSTRQALLFTSLVQRPAKKSSFDTKKRTNALLEELGLSEVRHTCISDLTDAEKKRLLIAVNLLLDTDILLLDQPTKGMDIFDTFFLVEYLRQWALISGRCVIMTISPSTYEIFTMLSRIALISSGRVIYFGKRSELLSYFAYIDFPCPAYKNPSDYYLDLVTLDNLSSEAMLESSQRIESLVELYSRRNNNALSAPGPPSITPPPVHRANFIIQFLALWIRALIFTFPYNVIHLFVQLFAALCLSVMCGVIYWHVRSGREQEYIWDRIGFYHAILSIFTIPLMLIELNSVHKEKQFVLNEVKLKFYGKSAYLMSKLIYSLPQTLIVYIAFALPACSMAGLQQNLPIYLLLMLSYLLTLRMITIAIVWSFRKRSTAAIVLGIVLSLTFLSSGTTFHIKDLSIATHWLNNASPTRWAHEALISWEFDNNSTFSPPFLCSRNPIVQQPNAILVRADCGFQSRTNILKWFRYKGGQPTGTSIRPIWHPFVAFALISGAFLIVGSILFCLSGRRKASKLRK